MVIFDCERMKHLNTGLSVFCDNVAKSLTRQKAALRDQLCFFVPKTLRGRWGDDVLYKTVTPAYKLFMPGMSDVKALTRRIRKFYKSIEFFFVGIILCVENAGFFPFFLPFFLCRFKIVIGHRFINPLKKIIIKNQSVTM